MRRPLFILALAACLMAVVPAAQASSVTAGASAAVPSSAVTPVLLAAQQPIPDVDIDVDREEAWWRSPVVIGIGVLLLVLLIVVAARGGRTTTIDRRP